jgi:hypothetical protein
MREHGLANGVRWPRRDTITMPVLPALADSDRYDQHVVGRSTWSATTSGWTWSRYVNRPPTPHSLPLGGR